MQPKIMDKLLWSGPEDLQTQHVQLYWLRPVTAVSTV